MNMFPKYYLLFCLFFITIIQSFAQTGTIKGTVFDSTKNEFFKAVNITIKGTKIGVSTDLSGNFIFNALKAGTYSLELTHTGYAEVIISNIIVNTGDTTDVGIIAMKNIAKEYTGVKVKAKRKTSSDIEVLKDVKKAESVVSAMSGEQITKSQDNNAGKAAARIPGVTLIEDRFIMIRGLGQRYNSVQINNINAPSTEVDRRSFSFDMVPSNMLDKILIFKSGAAELAGDFAGGVIKLYTRSNIEKDFINVNIGFGYRVNTTFKDHENNNIGGFSDYLGFDNGARALPSSFPASLAQTSNSTALTYGKKFPNNYQLTSTRAPLDFGAGISFGKNIRIGKKMNLFSINNIGYSSNYQYAAVSRIRYQYDQTTYVKEMFNYTDDMYSVDNKINLMSNWILNINKRNSLSFKNIFNQMGENETIIRNGVNPTERPTDEFKNYSFHYNSRSLYFGQFEGNHKINEAGDKLNYAGGFSYVKRNEPDYRRFRTYRTIGTTDLYTMIDPPSSSLFDAARFYSVLNEHTISGTINYEKNFKNKFDSSKNIVLRAGTYLETKSRDFAARWFGYIYNGQGVVKEDFLKEPIDQIFRPENMNTTAGWRPSEGTNPNDKYTAFNKLAAFYTGMTIPLNKLNVSFGLRAESFKQGLNSATQSDTIIVKLNNLNFLPSVNLSYYLTEKSLLRLAYYRTVNRPEFRELAPLVYYDFVYDVNIVGNPYLKSATIYNLDMRYEIYPSSSETVSFGLFYKKFLNPIENYVQPIGLSQQFTLQNAKAATNYGAEVEVRKSFDDMTQNSFLKKMSVVLNAAFIYSLVDLGDDPNLSQSRTRALQGQSPYIINAALYYNNEKKGFNVNLSYNVFGKRIAYVGSNIFPTVYEMPRQAIDLTMIKEVGKKMTLKFGIGDLLNFKYRLWQDTNNDGKIEYNTPNTDQQLVAYRKGQIFTFGLSYKIK